MGHVAGFPGRFLKCRNTPDMALHAVHLGVLGSLVCKSILGMDGVACVGAERVTVAVLPGRDARGAHERKNYQYAKHRTHCQRDHLFCFHWSPSFRFFLYLIVPTRA